MNEQADNLGRKVGKGVAWSVVMRVAIRSIGLVSTVILARLLVPEDFGLVALATMAVAVLSVMGGFGFDTYLIQNQKADSSYYDTAWTLTILRGVVIAILLAATANNLATFFEDARLESVFYWMAVASIIAGFGNIGVVNFRKNFEFHKDFTLRVASRLGNFAVTVPLAFIWRNYWALVAGMIAGMFIRVALGYLMHSYRPKLSLSKWREIMSFSKWLLGSNILRLVQNRSDSLIIGKLIGASGLGIYTVAYDLSTLASGELIAPIRRAILPGYSMISHDSARLRHVFLHSLAVIVAVGLPVGAGIGLTADLFIPLLLGSKWLETIPLIQILTVSGLLQMGSSTTTAVLVTTGRPHLVTVGMLCSVVIGLPLILLGALGWGIQGAAWGTVGASAALSTLFLVFGVRAAKVRWREILAFTWRTLFSLAIMSIVVRALIAAIPQPDVLYLLAVKLVVVAATGAAVYVTIHLLLWRLSGMPEGAEERLLSVGQEAFQRFRSAIASARWWQKNT